MAATESDLFSSNIAVRITTVLAKHRPEAVAIEGSGLIYNTTHSNMYIYVFTALHCILGNRERQDETNTYSLELNDIDYVLVEHNQSLDGGQFTRSIVPVSNIIIDKANDFCVLKVDRSLISHINVFPEILLHRDKRKEGTFRSSGYAGLNRNNFLPMTHSFVSADPNGIFVIKVDGTIAGEMASEYIGGYSGSGLFMSKKNVLVGIITKLHNPVALADQLQVRDISCIDVNKMLYDADQKNELLVYSDNARKIITDDDNRVIDLSRVRVNGVVLDIWKAIGNIRKDLNDDWFIDPVRSRDMLHSETTYRELVENMKQGNFIPQSAEQFVVPKQGFTIRKATQITFLDRVVYQAVVDYLAFELDNKVLLGNVYAARYNYNRKTSQDYFLINSVEQWRKFQYQIHSELNDTSSHLVVTDITNFFDSIDIETMVKVLKDYSSHVSNGYEYLQAVELVGQLLKSWEVGSEHSRRGIPQNKEPSAFLANILLAHIDRHMIIEYPMYYRFMDDIRIICKDKYQARKAVMSLIQLLAELGLNLNAQKTKLLNFTNDADKAIISEYTPALDKEIEQISSLIDSGKARELQIAVSMVDELFHSSESRDSYAADRKKFVFALERLQRFARTPRLRDQINFAQVVEAIVRRWEDNPWHTDIYAKFLLAIEANYLTQDLIDIMAHIITDSERNIYPWQAYTIFKVLAYHKIKNIQLENYCKLLLLRDFASERAAEVGGACIYLAATDPHAIDAIKRAYNMGIFRTYFSQRCALLALQTISPTSLVYQNANSSLMLFHRKAYEQHQNEQKTPVYVSGLPKLNFNQIAKDLPGIISLT